VPGPRPSRCDAPSSVAPQSTSGSRCPEYQRTAGHRIGSIPHLCRAISRSSQYRPRRPVYRLVHAHGATEMRRRAVGTPIFAERNLGQFCSSSRKNTIATKQNTVTLSRLRAISANMRQRAASEGGAIGPPLECVSMRLQVTNWRYAADRPAALLVLCTQSGQVWDEILQHHTEGHDLAEMERRNDATSQFT
jgi:hypothetical protein